MLASLFALLLATVVVLWSQHLWKNWLPSMSASLRGNEPPIRSGVVPFLGCAIDFGKGPPVAYLKRCAQTMGDIFTLHLAGRHMTFLMNEEHFEDFFSTDETTIDFQVATQPFLSRCFGVSKEAYFASHEKMLNKLRKTLLGTQIDSFIPQLSGLIESHLSAHWPSKGSQQVALLSSIRHLMFHTTIRSLFGPAYARFSAKAADVDEVVADFHAFDSWFELASSSVPHIMLPAFTKSKAKLLAMLSDFCAAYAEGGEGDTVAEAMRETLGDEGLRNWLLAVVWAAEANTIPTLFWLLSYLARHEAEREAIVTELRALLAGRKVYQLLWAELQECQSLQHAVQETIRLHSPPIILRGVQQPVAIGGHVIPAGHFLCLSPYWAHRKAELYGPDASEWKPSRWAGRTAAKYDFLAFGAGKYRCPGQNLAYLTLMLVALKLLLGYRVTDSGPMPKVEEGNLVGITKPQADRVVTITPL